MLELLVSVFLCYGIVNIIVQGSIFDGIKDKMEKIVERNKYSSITFFTKQVLTLINCPMCSGFWVGVIIGFFLGPFGFWNVLFNGSFYSGTTWLIWCLAQRLGQGEDPAMTHNVVFPSDTYINMNDVTDRNEK